MVCGTITRSWGWSCAQIEAYQTNISNKDEKRSQKYKQIITIHKLTLVLVKKNDKLGKQRWDKHERIKDDSGCRR